MKRRARSSPAATRARTSGSNPATAAAAKDLAESHRRAKAASTPVARAATRRIVENKLALYSPEAARQAAEMVKQGTGSGSAKTPARKSTRGGKTTRGRR